MGILLHQELTREHDRSLHVHLDDTSPGYKIRPPLVKWQQWQQSWELASKKGGLVNFVTNLNPNSSQLCQFSWDSEKDLRPRITLHLSNLQSPMPTQLRGDLGTILSVTYFCMHASCDLTSPLLDCLNIKCLSFWDSETSSENFVDLNLVTRVFWLFGQWGNALPLWPESLKTLGIRLCWPPSDIDNTLLKWERCESINIRVVNIIQEWPQRRQEIQKLQNNVQILRANKFALSQFWHTLEGFSLRTPFHRWGYQSFTEWISHFCACWMADIQSCTEKRGVVQGPESIIS